MTHRRDGGRIFRAGIGRQEPSKRLIGRSGTDALDGSPVRAESRGRLANKPKGEPSWVVMGAPEVFGPLVYGYDVRLSRLPALECPGGVEANGRRQGVSGF